MNRETIILLGMLFIVGAILAVVGLLIVDAMVLQPPAEPSVNVTGEIMVGL